MPIYEYRCPDCGHTFERLQKMSADPIKDCPSCSEANVTKLISASAFHLKGGGWYSDHYGLKSDSGDTSSTPAGTTSGSSDAASKPAADSAPAAAPSAPAAPASPSSSTSSSE